LLRSCRAGGVADGVIGERSLPARCLVVRRPIYKTRGREPYGGGGAEKEELADNNFDSDLCSTR